MSGLEVFTDPEGLETGLLPLPDEPEPVVVIFFSLEEGSLESEGRLGLEGSWLVLPEGVSLVLSPEELEPEPVLVILGFWLGSSLGKSSLGFSSSLGP